MTSFAKYAVDVTCCYISVRFGEWMAFTLPQIGIFIMLTCIFLGGRSVAATRWR